MNTEETLDQTLINLDQSLLRLDHCLGDLSQCGPGPSFWCGTSLRRHDTGSACFRGSWRNGFEALTGP